MEALSFLPYFIIMAYVVPCGMVLYCNILDLPKQSALFYWVIIPVLLIIAQYFMLIRAIPNVDWSF